MERIVAAVFLVVVAIGPAFAWIDALACCPKHEDATLVAGSDCIAPVCCSISAAVPARPADERLVGTAVTTTPAPLVAAPTRATTPRQPLAGDSSPAHSQTSPVLLR